MLNYSYSTAFRFFQKLNKTMGFLHRVLQPACWHFMRNPERQFLTREKNKGKVGMNTANMAMQGPETIIR